MYFKEQRKAGPINTFTGNTTSLYALMFYTQHVFINRGCSDII